MSATPMSFALPLPAASAWRQAGVALALTLAVWLALYYPTLWSMVQIWARSDTFAHGFVVPPLVLWLLWRQRAQLAQRMPQAAPALLPLVALLGLLWLLGELAAANALAQWSVVALLLLCVPVLLGLQVARSLLFPLLFLFFAVPLGEFLLPLLMEWTADVTVLALRLSGLPVYREGRNFVIPSGNWTVVEACSGVRYLIASFMVGSLFAYLSYQSWQRRLVFMLVSLLVPVLANWMRAYLIVMLGHLSGNRLAVGVDHVLYGWLFFGVVIALMFVVGARWAQPPAPASAVLPGAAPLPWAAALAGPARPGRSRASGPRLWGGVQPWLVLLALLTLLALPPLALQALNRQAELRDVLPPSPAAAQAPQLSAAPVLGPAWPLAAAPGALPVFTPAYREPSQELQAVYGPPDRPVGLYVAQYRAQRRGHSLVSSSNSLLGAGASAWVEAGSSRQTVALPGRRLQLHSSLLQPLGLRGLRAERPAAPGLLVWQLYWVQGLATTSAPLAKAYGAWLRLMGQRDDAAMLLAYVPAGPAAAPTLQAFWRDNYAALDAWLRQPPHTTQKEVAP